MRKLDEKVPKCPSTEQNISHCPNAFSAHCICKIPQSNSEFQTQIQPQRPGWFSNGEVINYTLDGVSIHPVTTNIQAFFLTPLPERKETAQGFHHEANGDSKTGSEFLMAVIGKK